MMAWTRLCVSLLEGFLEKSLSSKLHEILRILIQIPTVHKVLMGETEWEKAARGTSDSWAMAEGREVVVPGFVC